MGEEEKDEKRYMHIDTSCKLHENRDTGIAYRLVGLDMHKGLTLSKRFKRELKRRLGADKDYARIYAIAIYCLIKDDLDLFDILVICGDEKYSLVKKYLDWLFDEDISYLKKKVISLYELRKTTGKKKLKSYADNIARSYRRRALKALGRKQKGISLNSIKLNYNNLKEKWNLIGNMKKNVSGE